jgi:hypothetical protein
LSGVLDIAGLTVNAILSINLEIRLALFRFHYFINACWTIESCWLTELG